MKLRNRLIIIALFFIAGVLVVSTARAQWQEPDETAAPPNEGGTEAPLNTSGVAQTKAGPFTINGTLDVLSADGLSVGDALNANVIRVTDGRICINGECRDSFDQDNFEYLHLSPTASDPGFILLGDSAQAKEGNLTINAAGPIGLYAKAGAPNTRDTHGLFAVAGEKLEVDDFMSAGLYGQAGSNSNYSVGVGGTTANPAWENAYAAYFKGRMEIAGCLRFNGGDCLSEWPSSVPVGNYVELLDEGDVSQLGNVDLSPTSTTAFTSLVLGSDPEGLDIDITCGDGICNNGETADTCPADCFFISELKVSGITDGTAVIGWKTSAPATSIVRYGRTDDLDSEIVDDTLVTLHLVQLSSLDNDTTYFYQVGSVTEGGGIRISKVNTFKSLLDQTPPAAPTNLRTTTPSPSRIPILWFHTHQDNPGGTGFSRFRIYRDDVLLDETENDYFEDEFVEPDANYTYQVSAVDVQGNESQRSNSLLVHVPTPCATHNDCTNPLYPLCCGENGCKESCGGSSPIMAKVFYNETYVGPENPPGGGWF